MSFGYDKVTSLTVANDQFKQLSLNHEGWSIIDVTGDGIRDIVITNGGDPADAISDADPPIAILKGNPDYSFSLADTSTLPPTGWVNDYIFLDSNGDGLLEIVAIDHGRELAYDPMYWSLLWVYEYDAVSESFIDITDKTVGNTVAFHHNASNSADLNLDGLPDFVVAQMGPANLQIFEGDPASIFVETTSATLGNDFPEITNWNASKYVGYGSAGLIDIGGDGDYDVIGLPYADGGDTRNQDSALVLEFDQGKMIRSSLFNVRQLDSSVVPEAWGYSYFSVEDLNNDGLQDIVAFAENPNNNAGGTAIFVSLLQRPNGEFESIRSFPNEPLITERRGEIFANNIWHDYQFSLEDLDADGDVDLFWGAWFGGNADYFEDGIFLNDGTGRFTRYTDSPGYLSHLDLVDWGLNSRAREMMVDLNFDAIGDFVILESEWRDGIEFVTPTTYLSKPDRPGVLKISAPSSQYEIAVYDDGFRITDRLWFDGIIDSRSSYRVEFTDTNIAFDLASSAGQTAKTLAAVIGADGLSNREYVGIGLELFDAGQSLTSVCELALNAVGATTHADVVNLLYTNLFGEAPTEAQAQEYIFALDAGVFTRGFLAAAAAELTDDLGVIDLIGLAETGIEYL